MSDTTVEHDVCYGCGELPMIAITIIPWGSKITCENCGWEMRGDGIDELWAAWNKAMREKSTVEERKPHE